MDFLTQDNLHFRLEFDFKALPSKNDNSNFKITRVISKVTFYKNNLQIQTPLI